MRGGVASLHGEPQAVARSTLAGAACITAALGVLQGMVRKFAVLGIFHGAARAAAVLSMLGLLTAPGAASAAAPGPITAPGLELSPLATSAPAGSGRRPASDPPDTLRIIEDQSILAVVVQTTGLFATFAPDHLVQAEEFQAELVLDPDRPEDATFRVRVRPAALVVDDPARQADVEDRLVELTILDEPYDTTDDDDREDVRASMLAQGQLHAAEHEWIEAEVIGIRDNGTDDFPWTVDLALTVRGATSVAPMSGRMERIEGGLRIEAFGAFRFTDFGIEPYSAFLGAVSNRDRFHLYLFLVAEDGRDGARL